MSAPIEPKYYNKNYERNALIYIYVKDYFF